MEMSVEVPQTIKHSYHVTLHFHSHVYITKRIQNIHSHKHLYTDPRATFFTVAQSWKHPRCPSAEEWMNIAEETMMPHAHHGMLPSCARDRVWHRLRGVGTLKTCWLKGVTLRSSHSLWFCLYEIPRIGKSVKLESGLVVARAWGRVGGGGKEDMTVNSSCFPYGDKNVLTLMLVIVV